MSRNHKRQKKLYKEVASHRIRYLFRLAEEYSLHGKLSLSNRYVMVARQLSMKYLVPIPREYKRRFCSHCYCYLLPSVNCRVRIHRGMIIIFCHSCKKYTRVPLRKHTSTSSIQ